MKKKNMHFSIVCSPEPFYAYFDPDKIDKILYNLLSNASKYNDLFINRDEYDKMVSKNNISSFIKNIYGDYETTFILNPETKE